MTTIEELKKSIGVLTERRNWLTARIAAKNSVGWDVEWDKRERDALAHVVGHVEELISLAQVVRAAMILPGEVL